jgi:hypothetical protein
MHDAELHIPAVHFHPLNADMFLPRPLAFHVSLLGQTHAIIRHTTRSAAEIQKPD